LGTCPVTNNNSAVWFYELLLVDVKQSGGMAFEGFLMTDLDCGLHVMNLVDFLTVLNEHSCTLKR
jgi:hypothetical protein